jgi:hypothetical protein
MPQRLLNIDYSMLMLNATSLGTLSLAWFSDNLNSFGGFVVMMSVAYLNYCKARNLNIKSKEDKEDK